MGTSCQPKPQAHRKPKYRPARRRTPTTPGIGKLKSLIWLQVWGEKIPDVGVRPNLTKDEYLERVRAGYLWPLTNTAIADHVSGDRTLYYMSKPDAAEALFMLDVDVLKALGLGTPEGALA